MEVYIWELRKRERIISHAVSYTHLDVYKRQANERIEQEKFNRSNENFLISKDANYRCMGSFTVSYTHLAWLLRPSYAYHSNRKPYHPYGSTANRDALVLLSGS